MSSSLSILTFNAGLLRVRMFGVTLFEFTPLVDERFQALSGELMGLNPDIICLQEVFLPAHRRQLIEQLKANYGHIAVYEKGRGLVSNGLIICSRHPIESFEFTSFRRGTWDEKLFGEQGFIRVKMRAPNGVEFEVYNTHMTAGGYFRLPEHKTVETIRQSQIAQLLDAVEQSACDIKILTGDFNCGPEASPSNYQALLDHSYKDCLVEALNGDVSTQYTWCRENPYNAKSFHAKSPSQRIDHILYKTSDSSAVKCETARIELLKRLSFGGKELKLPLSDHYGVWAQFSVSTL